MTTEVTSNNMISKEPINVPTEDILAKSPAEVQQILTRYGVAVIALPVDKGEMERALKETKFYNTANAMFKDEFKVAEPTTEELKKPAKYKKRKAGDDAQGMLHQYGTPLHTLIQMNPTLRATMSSLYGRDINYLPNRLRISRKFKNNGKTLHIEAHELFRTNKEGEIELIPGEVAMTIALRGTRLFGFWDLNGADLNPLKDYYEEHGSEFTLVDPDYMHQHYPGRRRMVNVDCDETPHVIMWQESNPHEIAGSPSLSIFVSPVKGFNNTEITKVTSYQPIEYLGLTYHQSDLLGLCYNMGGYEWPSGKKCYQYVHHRAWCHYRDKTKDEYKINGKFRQRLILTGEVDQHTTEYQAKLKEMKIELPEKVFHRSMPNFVVDITKLPITILKDYGFIKSDKKVDHVKLKSAGHLH
jgi:hypothetical protein